MALLSLRHVDILQRVYYFVSQIERAYQAVEPQPVYLCSIPIHKQCPSSLGFVPSAVPQYCQIFLSYMFIRRPSNLTVAQLSQSIPCPYQFVTVATDIRYFDGSCLLSVNCFNQPSC